MIGAIELLHDGERRPLCARIGGLLDRKDLEALIEATIAEEAWFVEASTEGGDGHRRARVLYTPVDEAEAVVDRVRHLAPRACRVLGEAMVGPGRMECQQTAYLDGGFYRAHRDDQGADVQDRAFSWVYYFHRLPRGYRGGGLRFHVGGSVQALDPRINELVVFPSGLCHEVAAVEVPSGAFADARFSVNGWLWP